MPLPQFKTLPKPIDNAKEREFNLTLRLKNTQYISVIKVWVAGPNAPIVQLNWLIHLSVY
jgi:hypothetical protein